MGMVMMMTEMIIIWLVIVPAGQMERKILLMIVTLPTPMTSSSYGCIPSCFFISASFLYFFKKIILFVFFHLFFFYICFFFIFANVIWNPYYGCIPPCDYRHCNAKSYCKIIGVVAFIWNDPQNGHPDHRFNQRKSNN